MVLERTALKLAQKKDDAHQHAALIKPENQVGRLVKFNVLKQLHFLQHPEIRHHFNPNVAYGKKEVNIQIGFEQTLGLFLKLLLNNIDIFKMLCTTFELFTSTQPISYFLMLLMNDVHNEFV